MQKQYTLEQRRAQWDELTETLIRETDVSVVRDGAICDAAAQDFGRLFRGKSRGVVQPRNTDELLSVISFANDHGIPMTARGRGYSQGGQSLTANGFTLELNQLNRVGQVEPESQTIKCEAGAQWQAVVAATIPYGMLPRVLPHNTNLSVGGVLSVGGIGSSSKNFGPVVANVVELDIVSGSGKRITCSRTKERSLFDAVLAGLGRCGIIANATIQLRRIKPYIRNFHLLYDSLESWFADQQALSLSKYCDYLEGFCWSSAKWMHPDATGGRAFAHWLYGLQVGFEHDGHAPEAQDVLKEMHYWKIVHTEDVETIQHVLQYEPRFSLMRQSGAWYQHHPWMEFFLPTNTLMEILPQVLDSLPLTLGDGHRTLMVASDNLPSFFMVPPGDNIVCFAVLPMGVPTSLREYTIETLQSVNDILLQAGAKRYLSGWLGSVDSSNWRIHYGKKYDAWVNMKRMYDPQNILGSQLLSFPR